MKPILRAGALAGRFAAVLALSGTFSATAFAQCPGWSNALGDFELTYFSTPRDAIVYDDGSGAGPTMWVAYTGSSTHNIAFGGVARFVGGAWIDTDPDPNRAGTSFAVYDAGSGPELYVGGRFGVRRFTNGAWVSVNLLYQDVQHLAVFDLGSGPELYAAGRSLAGATFCIVKLAAGTWVPLATGFSPSAMVNELAVFDSGGGPELYAAGNSLMPGPWVPIARLGFGGWVPVPIPSGTLQPVPDAIEVHDDGSGPRLCAQFRDVGGAYESRIGAFDGVGWTMLPGGISAGVPSIYPQILEMTSHAETASGPRSLYVTGSFVSAAGIPAQSVARWDGSSWSALGAGLDAWGSGKMLASLPGDAITPPRLVVGGSFEQAGGLGAHRIAMWEACSPSSVVVCAGDGSATACPCGNFGATGSGCASSLGAGATLRATGGASIGADSLVLTGASMPNSSALYFQGTSLVQGGAGVPFGDGLRCAGGTIVRLAVVANTGGASIYPSAGAPSVSVRGQVGAPGTRHYQVWYRNAAAFCTSATFNFTNALSVQWQP